jgi:FMN phosphatase YigB (HAD superfamily)
MIDTIMFDLDGTLLRFSQDDFINAYFAELRKVFIRLGLDADAAVKAVWVGTKAMILNDGSVLNTQRFWDAFSDFLDIRGERLNAVESACDNFYSNEFHTVKSVAAPSDIPKRIVHGMAAKGYCVVLTTNPLFPPCAVDSRLGWAGLDPRDFRLITHYENSAFCKPNLGYYREVFSKIGKTPQQCLMVGNNPTEDMCVGELGTETFLVTDFIENEAGADITSFRRGSIEEAEAFLMSLPNVWPL